MRSSPALPSALVALAVAAGLGRSLAMAQAPRDQPPFRGQVVVLKPSSVDEVLRTALARVTGELTAARFQVSIVPLDPAGDPTPQVETVAPELSPVAAFAIVRDPASNDETIAIWVCDRLGRRTTIQRMKMHGTDVSQDAEALAVEAIELIRVSIAGLWPAYTRGNESEAPSPETTVATGPVQPLRPKDRQLILGLGGAALQDVGMSSTQWLVALDAMVVWPVGAALRVQARGLGPGDTLPEATYGQASLHRELVLVGAAWVFWSEERIQSMVGISGGVAHLSAEGAAPDPARAHAGEAWSFAGSAGLGVAVRLGPRLGLALEMDAILALPRVNLSLDNATTKSLSAPGVLTSALLQARF